MVAVDRRGQVQQGLKQALDVRRLGQVLAADHVRHVLQGVVDDHGQVVGDPDVLARQHHVAGQLRSRLDRAPSVLDEGQALEAAQGVAGRSQ